MFTASGRIFVDMDFDGDKWQVARAFYEKYGRFPDVVYNDEEEHHLIGKCESCGQAIFEDQAYEYDLEDVIYFHEGCA